MDFTHTLNDKNHSPAMNRRKMRKLQNCRRQQPSKRTGQRRRRNKKRSPKRQLTTTIPPRQIKHNRRHHPGLHEAQHEAHTAEGREIPDIGGGDGGDAEADGDDGDEPAGAHDFAEHVGGDFEEGVGDEEDGEADAVVAAFHAEVFFETGDSGVSWVCELIVCLVESEEWVSSLPILARSMNESTTPLKSSQHISGYRYQSANGRPAHGISS